MQRKLLERASFFLSKGKDFIGMFSLNIVPPGDFTPMPIEDVPKNPLRFNDLLYEHRSRGLVLTYDNEDDVKHLLDHPYSRGNVRDMKVPYVYSQPLHNAFDNELDGDIMPYEFHRKLQNIEHMATPFIECNKHRGLVHLLLHGHGDLDVCLAARPAHNGDLDRRIIRDVFAQRHWNVLKQVPIGNSSGNLYQLLSRGIRSPRHPVTSDTWEQHMNVSLDDVHLCDLEDDLAEMPPVFKMEVPARLVSDLYALDLGPMTRDPKSPWGFYLSSCNSYGRIVDDAAEYMTMHCRNTCRFHGNTWVTVRLLLENKDALAFHKDREFLDPDLIKYLEAMYEILDIRNT